MRHQDDDIEIKTTGLISWFVHNHVAANVLMLLLLIGGVLSLANMRTETFPSIDPQMITISVPYPGATPYEIADSITSRIEEALIGTEGVKRITSTASEGAGIVTLELEDFADADDVYNDVDTTVNGLSDFPPQEAERPIVVKAKTTPNVLTLAIHGDISEDILKYWSETIESEIRQLPGVALTTLRGIRKYQISIEISESALRRYDLSMRDIGQAVSRFSADIPAGAIESEQGDVLLRVQQKKYTGQDFEKITIRTLPNGAQLYLKDIAKIVDGFEDVNLMSKFNAQRAAFIDVARSATEDTLKVAQIVKGYLNTVKIPEGLQVSIQSDQTVILKERMYLMLRNAVLGFMLVFLILLLFLDLKMAFWTSIAIPISFLGGLMVIHAFGYSLNMISLFALIVVLGIVVDDAIVIGESIFEAQEGHPPEEAGNDLRVLKGVRTVIAPVTIGVLTTIAAFAPLIFSTGTFGQIIKFVPIVVIPILLISLLEAYFILPAHLSHPGRWSRGVMASIRQKFAQGLHSFIKARLLPVARLLMRWRYATLSAFICLLIITVTMVTSGIVRFIFFPKIESSRVTISVAMEEGTPFQVTKASMLKIEEEVLAVRENLRNVGDDPFKSIAVSIGESSSGRSGGPRANRQTDNANHLGQMRIQLVPSDLREQSSLDIEDLIRARIANMPNIETLTFQSSLIGEEADIEIDLYHKDEETLNTAARDSKRAMSAIKGTKEVDDNFEAGKTEFLFELTDEGLALGLTPFALGQQLRYAYFGQEVQRFQRGRSEVIVYTRYPKKERERLLSLEDARIRLDDGREVPLLSVATIRKQLGYSKIHTVNGQRVVSVTGDVDQAMTTPDAVMSTLETRILPALQQRYTGLSYRFEGESREQREDLASLGRNMMIAFLVIYVLLSSQLRSYIQPLVIMIAIPFGVVGAIWGHFLLGYDISFVSLFGIVALTGVVINDSVVLIDYYNRQKKEGLTTFQSLENAIARRFRPILLTTLTTSLGLLPMLLETSMQATFLIPMVVSLATGILFATFVILLLIPCVILILDDLKSLQAHLNAS